MTPLSASFVKAQAARAGFDVSGIAPAHRFPRLGRLREWIALGYAGDMQYLEKSLDERLDPAKVLASAKTVISLGSVYNTAPPTSSPIARYARGDDYHDVIRERLRRLLQALAAEAGAGFEAFSSVDNGPVQERVFAEQAGLGWIGKNTCLINPRLGSWLFLSEVLTNAEMAADVPAVDQCGTCTRCLDACPTQAFRAPYQLDATRCLSYLTIERRGPIAGELRASIRDEVFGCDICQDVCPWNRRAAVSGDPAWRPREPFVSGGVAVLCALSDEAWRAAIRGSALRRAGLTRLRRSLAFAAAHLPAGEAGAALDALADHPSAAAPEVADAIAWARARVSGG